MTGLAPVSEEYRKTYVLGLWLRGRVLACLGLVLDSVPGGGGGMKERRKERGRTRREGAACESSVLSTYLLFGVSCSAEVSSARQQECVRGEVR